MENNSLYRKNSLDRIQSPEQLSDYLRVTTPSVWVILAAVALMLAGILIWSGFACVSSTVRGTAVVDDGIMIVTFEDEGTEGKVREGMAVSVGEAQSDITSVGRGEGGRVFAIAPTMLSDGTYEAKVTYRKTQILKLLFN